jgi:hypothetical protein
MALDLKLEELKPFLPPLDTDEETRVKAWIPVLTLLLDQRYRDRIIEANRVLFVSAAADALERRLGKPRGLIDQEGAGPFTTRYNPRAALSRWFLPEELEQLDDATGLGGNIRSVRTPAPDAFRFGNTSRSFDDVDESDEGDEVILP